MSTRIRGTAILNIDANPLIVINGVLYQNIAASGFDYATADERDYAAVIGIPQDDIEEISIVRDAASVAQFGSAAAKGIILITTKRGLKGKPVFNYRYEGSVRHQPKGYEVLSGDQYGMLMREAFHNAYNTYDVPEEFANDPTSSLFYLYGQNTDWFKEITRTGQISPKVSLMSPKVSLTSLKLSAMSAEGPDSSKKAPASSSKVCGFARDIPVIDASHATRFKII